MMNRFQILSQFVDVSNNSKKTTVLSEDNSIKNMYLNEDVKGTKVYTDLLSLTPGSQCIITHTFTNTKEDMRVTKMSKIYTKIARFAPNARVVNEFYNPPIVSAKEAMRSPSKRRVNFIGSVTNVGDVKEGPHYKRRIVSVNDGEDVIQLKLWGEKTDKDVDCNTELKFTNLLVEHYDNQTSLSSTSETKIEQALKDGELKMTIVGIGDTELVSRDRIYKICIKDQPKTEDLPLSVTATCVNGVIVAIKKD